MNPARSVHDPYLNLAPEYMHYGASALRSLIWTVALLVLLVVSVFGLAG